MKKQNKRHDVKNKKQEAKNKKTHCRISLNIELEKT